MTQEEILKVIIENPGIKMCDVHKKLGCDRSVISEQIRALARKEMITREIMKSDQTYRLWSNV